MQDMNFTVERARTQSITPAELLKRTFGELPGASDALFLDAARTAVFGFCGLPFTAPVCGRLLNNGAVGAMLRAKQGSLLLAPAENGYALRTESGSEPVPEALAEQIREEVRLVLAAPGKLNDRGELALDLKTCPVGTHYPVNLLLGSRAGYPCPLQTTPKSALDSLGRGSFRASAGTQVLATRYVMQLEENGEPANRQFYLTENGKQIFYSANVRENVAEATCVHSQNRTVITYKTECGLEIRRTIFILPQEDGMPNAVETQRVEVTNLGTAPRALQLVFTGMFAITGPDTLANDVVYANVTVESELWYADGRPAAMSVHHQPKYSQNEKRFALLLCGGETMDGYCANLPEFLGSGNLEHPDLVGALPNTYNRKMSPFFAMSKRVSVAPGEKAVVDEFVGILEGEGDVHPAFDRALRCLLEKYSNPRAWEETFRGVVDFWNRYPSYLVPETEDVRFNAYVSRNLPFQTLYQTYVSRSFAWTQKAYRETGFREIQDIYASMYYLSALGMNGLVKELLSGWIGNVFRMGYAYHNFTFRGKEPGDCSDDALWLLQAVERYLSLTGDYGFLLEEYPIAGESGKRSLWDTVMAILTYSGRISVGAHGMPLLDKADWNDTLRLDSCVLQGPEKEALYRKQLEEKGQPYGVRWENTLTESVMNACLLIIAADAAAAMAKHIGREADGAEAAAIAAGLRESMRKDAWRGDYFARCLINDGRGYEYLGAGKDGLSAVPEIDGTYFLNTFSWPILADAATEEQIAVMLDRVEKYLKTPAGLKLCTLVDFDKLKIFCGTSLYFPGDRENGGVFKHAAMMAVTAALRAAKWVREEALARRLSDLAFFMIDRTLPYTAMDDPFVLKGNPRFCTQYNNSETCENIGPMLSGTASWLTLAVFEFTGARISESALCLSPVLREGMKELRYTLNLFGCSLKIGITGNGKLRADEHSRYTLDGVPCGSVIPLPTDGETHTVSLIL